MLSKLDPLLLRVPTRKRRMRCARTYVETQFVNEDAWFCSTNRIPFRCTYARRGQQNTGDRAPASARSSDYRACLSSQPPPPLFVSPFFSSSSSSSSSLRRARPPCAVVSLRISRHDREPNPMNIRSRLYPAQPCDAAAAFRPTGSTKRLRTTRAGITIISAILGWRNLFEGRILCENLKQRRREWRRRGKGVGSRSRTTSSKDSR